MDLHALQVETSAWARECLGIPTFNDRLERCARLLEEALECAQAGGLRQEDALRLLYSVYARPPGIIMQEVGGVALTLAAFCSVFGVSLNYCAMEELARVWRPGVMEIIRRKQEGKVHPTP